MTRQYRNHRSQLNSGIKRKRNKRTGKSKRSCTQAGIIKQSKLPSLFLSKMRDTKHYITKPEPNMNTYTQGEQEAGLHMKVHN